MIKAPAESSYTHPEPSSVLELDDADETLPQSSDETERNPRQRDAGGGQRPASADRDPFALHNGNDAPHQPEVMPQDESHPLTPPPPRPLAAAPEYPLVLSELSMMRNGVAVLDSISLAVPRGCCCAILGESGAGKSTLLKLLARKLELSLLEIKGTGLVPANIWSIPQDLNVLYEFDTAVGCVTFVHKMLHRSSRAQADAAARELLAEVGFPARNMDSLIGKLGEGLTAGQRRMVSVAQALCAGAEMIFLDEPTTGLSSDSCATIVQKLREICRKKHITVVCTIHQPSDAVLDCFDQIVVMSAGRAFMPPDGFDALKAATSDESEAERLLAMVRSKALPLSRIDGLAHEQIPSVVLSTPIAPQLPFTSDSGSLFRDLPFLLERTARRQWANVFAFRFRFAVTFILAMIVAFAFFQLSYTDPTQLRDQLGIYIALTGTSFVPIIIAASVFPSERASFLNELSQCHHYSIAAFMISRSVFEVFMAFATTWWMPLFAAVVGIPFSVHQLWFTNVLQVIVSDSFGFMLATRFSPEVAIGALIPSVGLLSCLLGTGVAAPPQSGSGWIFHMTKWLSFFKFGFAGFLLDQFPRMSGSCVRGVDDGCAFSDAAEVLAQFVFEGDDHTAFVNRIEFQWLMCALLALAMRIASYLLLCRLAASDLIRYENVTNWAALAAANAERIAGTLPAGTEEEASRNRDVSIQQSPDDVPEGSDDIPATPVSVEERLQLSTRNASFSMGVRAMLEFGDLTLTVRSDGSADTGTNESVQPTRKVLDGVSGVARAGRVTALIGPSLSGKSALLRVLSGQSAVDGLVSCEGRIALTVEAHAMNTYTTRLVYQQDAFTSGDTVWSAVRRQVDLCRPDEAEELKVSDVRWALSCVGLDHVCKKRITATSGGEQRRLSIACQLVHRPHVLLCDDATSGLDSQRAVEVIGSIREYAQTSNAVVICTLQQPGKSLLLLVDELIVMSASSVVFRGSTAAAMLQFNITSTEVERKAATDVLLERIADAEGSELASTWAAEVHSPFADGRARPPPAHPTRSATASALQALRVLIRRNSAARLSSPLLFVGELLIKFIAFPLVLGALFAQVDDPHLLNRTGLCFISNAGFGFIGLIVPVVLMALEREVFTRDISAGDYGSSTYQLARWLFELPGELAGIVAGAGILYAIVGFKQSPATFIFSTFVGYTAMNGFGYILAALPVPLSVSAGLAGFFTIVMMVGCGIVVTPRQTARVGFMFLLEFTSPIRHALSVQVHAEAATITPRLVNVSLPASVLDPGAAANASIEMETVFSGDMVLREFQFTRWQDGEGVAWLLLCITLLVYRIGALALLALVTWNTKRHFALPVPQESRLGSPASPSPDARPLREADAAGVARPDKEECENRGVMGGITLAVSEQFEMMPSPNSNSQSMVVEEAAAAPA